jgi:hypothetical protein
MKDVGLMLHVVCMGDDRNECKVLVGNLKESDSTYWSKHQLSEGTKLQNIA